MVTIKEFFGTSQEEVELKKYNPFIGISLGNQYFSKDVIKQYTEWSLDYCKDNVAILIADDVHAINYEILKNQRPEEALHKATELGNDCMAMVQKVWSGLPKAQQKLVIIARWAEVTASESFRHSYSVLKEFFTHDENFKTAIIEQMVKNLGQRVLTLQPSEQGRLAEYLLNEIAVFINGVQLRGMIYDLNLYPGVGFNKLITDLQNGSRFPDLSQKLSIKHKVAYLEAYVK